MNSENLAFLLDNLKYLGFGEKPLLDEQLEQQITHETKEFQLHTESFYDEDYKVEAILHFRRSDRFDMYFFNKYEAFLKKGDNAETERMQTFYISKGTGVTLKEAFNLLQGRAVNKDLTNTEGEKYNAWIQLNFEEMDLNHNYKIKYFGSRYGYDLEKVLEKYPIKELKMEESKVLLLKALKRGNLQPVYFMKPNNKVEKMYVEASPQFKTINIYTSVAKAMQKLVKKPAYAGEVSRKPGGPETGDRKEEEATAEEATTEESAMTEEGGEEGTTIPENTPTAKKRSRK